MAKKKRRTDGACYIDENGVMTNSLLHQQLLEGVDDSDLQRDASELIQSLGFTKKEADEMTGLRALKL